MCYAVVRRILFLFPAEFSHSLSLWLLRLWATCIPVSWMARQQQGGREVTVKGLTLPHRIGLAGGLDKNGDCIDAMLALGFACVEVGTVTPLPQSGNPKPRLFRLVKDRALINRMGFNNKGVDYCVKRLRQRRFPGVVGVNIGKNKQTPLAQAHEDYATCLRKVFPYADYIVINISSPNTPGLRDLGQEEALSTLLGHLQPLMVELTEQYQRRPLWLFKISVDVPDAFLPTFVRLLSSAGVDGVITSNTTLDREGLVSVERSQSGGLSGQPLTERALAQLAALRALDADLLLVAAGGVMTAADVTARVAAGADVVQLYTGFIYHGSALIQQSRCV